MASHSYIPYGRQSISADDVRAVVDVLQSAFLTQGPAVDQFERVVASYCGVPEAIAVNSATSALHIACLALQIGPGDLVWTSPISFVASSNCALYCGADVDFVDIDPETFNMSPLRLEEKLEAAGVAGRLPKVVIPVHMAGQPCDMEAIARLAGEYGFAVLEDASHAIGARYRESTIGDCRYSNATVFSFHPVKIITSAEGGMVTTKDPTLANRLRSLRSHGITREHSEFQMPDEGGWYYEQQALGLNYRITDIQSALGISQMARIDEWIDRRHRIADRYDRELGALPLILPIRQVDSRQALHLYIIQVDGSKTPVTRRALFDALRAANVGVNVHYIPIYTQPYYRCHGHRDTCCPVSEAYYRRCISLPIYADLTVEDQDYVIDCLQRVLTQ